MTSAAGSAARAGAVVAGVVSRSPGAGRARADRGGQRRQGGDLDLRLGGLLDGRGSGAARRVRRRRRRGAAWRPGPRSGPGAGSRRPGGGPRSRSAKVRGAAESARPDHTRRRGWREAGRRAGRARGRYRCPRLSASRASATGQGAKASLRNLDARGQDTSSIPARRTAGAIRVTVTVSSAAHTQADATSVTMTAAGDSRNSDRVSTARCFSRSKYLSLMAKGIHSRSKANKNTPCTCVATVTTEMWRKPAAFLRVRAVFAPAQMLVFLKIASGIALITAITTRQIGRT